MNGKADIEDQLENALLHVAEPARKNFRVMYKWFMAGGDTEARLPLGKRFIHLGADPDFAFSAQRGIHAPNKKWFSGGTQYAASISTSIGSIYDASGQGEPFLDLGDGTWILSYSAHRNNKGNTTDMRWNNALLNNWIDGVPVGVFRKTPNSKGYRRALAWVDSFNWASGVFLIHGPITADTQQSLQPDTVVEEIDFPRSPKVSELLEDTRQREWVKTALRSGQQQFRQALLRAYDGCCAVTGCNVHEVLQAAHIMDYRGERSNVPQNGILLREDVHTLFDSYLIGIHPDTHLIEVSDQLTGTEYEALRDKRMRLPIEKKLKPNEAYIRFKYETFSKRLAS